MLILENDNLKVTFFENSPFPAEIVNKLAATTTVFKDQKLLLQFNGQPEFRIDQCKCYSHYQEESKVDFLAEREGLSVRVYCQLSGTEFSIHARIENGTAQSLQLSYIDLFRSFLNCGAKKQTINGDASLGDAGQADLNLQHLVEAYPIFLDTGLYCGIDWPVALNECINGEIVCRQYLGDTLTPGGHFTTRSLTFGAACDGKTAEAFMEHLKRMRGRETRRASFYFDWLTHASEGVTEEEMSLHLDMLERLKEEYGIHFDIYAVDDGIVETRWNCTYDRYRLQQDCLFENGLKAQADRCARLGMDFGVWLGPDGFGHTEADAQKRIADVCEMLKNWNVRLMKLDVCVSPALNNDPYHNERYMRIFEQLIQKCRDIRSDLIVINHRITNSPYILAILDSTLWQGAECYPDVFLFNGDKPRLFSRYACYGRGLPAYFGVYSELLEDHGICFNGLHNGWENEFVIQTFGRALMLSPEVYGCLFLLPDESFMQMGRLLKLAKEKKDFLGYGRCVAETGDFIQSDGERALLCIINDSWDKNTRKIKIEELLSFMPVHHVYEVRCIYPQDMDQSIKVACNEEIKINLHPFAVCLLEFTPYSNEKTVSTMESQRLVFNTLAEHVMEHCATHIKDFQRMEPGKSDITYVEKVRFLLSSDPIEAQVITGMPASRMKEVNRCRELFFNKLKRDSRGVASNAWDNDPCTAWSDQAHWRDSDNVWRIDLGSGHAVERVEVQLSNMRPGPVCGMEHGRVLEEPIWFEISQDAFHWVSADAKIFFKRLPSEPYELVDKLIAEFDPPLPEARYLRMHLKGVLVSDICIKERAGDRLVKIDRKLWHGNNLLTARPSKAIYQAKVQMEDIQPNQYLAVTASLKSPDKISLDQETAVVWLEGDGGAWWPFVNSSPVYPTNRWECETTLHGNAAWTYWIPVTPAMQQRELMIRLAWFGVEKGSECLDTQEPEIIAHLITQ